MHGAQLVACSPSMREALLRATQRQVWWQIVILLPRRWRQENKKFKVIVSDIASLKSALRREKSTVELFMTCDGQMGGCTV